MKKQSCRMTPQEREAHKEAIKLRKMTDRQLVDYVNGLKIRAEKAEAEAVKNAKNAVNAVKNRNAGGKAVVESFFTGVESKDWIWKRNRKRHDF